MSLLQNIKDSLRGWLLRFGISATRVGTSNNADALTLTLLKRQRVDLVIDVGAHEGEFALGVLRANKKIPIFSYEPLPDVFKRLSQTARGFDKWKVHNLALGDARGYAEINVSANRTASSLLQPSDTGLGHDGFETVKRVKIQVERLDHVLLQNEILGGGRRSRIYLKLDVQGFELSVLEGAGQLLDQVVACQVEMSFVELYNSQPSAYAVYSWLIQRGFHLNSVSNTLRSNITGALQQIDGFFIKDQEQIS
jgi:FkbM family methyltransferase